MVRCDVLIVGGGPAGSACATGLVAAGIDVVVVDARRFPRDKVCAGWVTPPVFEMLGISPREYAASRVLQPIHGFRVSIDGREPVDVDHGEVVSYGVRRFELDEFLLRRSGARVVEGHRVRELRRAQERWIVDDRFHARVLVGAGGHFCPVARLLRPERERVLVAASELELQLEPAAWRDVPVREDLPEIVFSRQLDGYGWAFRKRDWINVGVGREIVRGRDRPPSGAQFVERLRAQGRIPTAVRGGVRGHAYLTWGGRERALGADHVLLVGDAAGLAHPRSGEGIRPAVVSGLLAAANIGERSAASSLQARYESALRERLQLHPRARGLLGALPERMRSELAALALRVPGVARHIVDAWFLGR